MLKILMLGRLPHAEIGGVPVFTALLSRALTERGHSVFVIHPGSASRDETSYLFPVGFGFQVPQLSSRYATTLLATISSLRGLARRFRESPPDLIHIHYGNAFDLALIPFARRYRKPLVVTAHCSEPWMHLRYAGRVAISALRNASLVLCISEAQQTFFQNLGLPPQKILQCGTAIDSIFFSQTHRDTSMSSPRRCGFMGRIAPEKGVLDLVQALSRLDAKERPLLLLMGPGTTSFLQEILSLVAKLSLENFVSLVDPTPDPHSRCDFLDALDFYVHPTYSDVTPLAVIEALARRKPVLASSLPGTKELVGDIGVLFRPGDIAGIADGIRQITYRLDSCQKALAGNSHAILQFSPSSLALRTEEAYYRVLRDSSLQ